jgi:urea transport system substrate-binding protein
VQYEGLEQSPNIIYTGSVPIPATRWALSNLGKRVYLVGSDYIFPRAANWIIKDFIRVTYAKLLGERYVPLDSYDFDFIVTEIEKLKPDAIINTLNGDLSTVIRTKS